MCQLKRSKLQLGQGHLPCDYPSRRIRTRLKAPNTLDILLENSSRSGPSAGIDALLVLGGT